MSTYGTAFVVDLPPGVDPSRVVPRLAPTSGIYRAELPNGWTRLTGGSGEIGLVPLVSAVLADVDHARAAIAEDNDEYGALWIVLEAIGGVVRTVHRRYVLNADPLDPDDVALALEDHAPIDPRDLDVAGPVAAADAAHVFGTDPQAMQAAERQAVTAFESIGVVGGPFLWWSALKLAWPGDDAAGVAIPAP